MSTYWPPPNTASSTRIDTYEDYEGKQTTTLKRKKVLRPPQERVRQGSGLHLSSVQSKFLVDNLVILTTFSSFLEKVEQ